MGRQFPGSDKLPCFGISDTVPLDHIEGKIPVCKDVTYIQQIISGIPISTSLHCFMFISGTPLDFDRSIYQ